MTHHHRRSPPVMLILAAWLLHGPIAAAAPDADLWPHWQDHDAESTVRIDTQAWSDWLAAQVVMEADSITRIDYRKVSEDSRTDLDRIIQRWSGLPIADYNRSEQLAYWINLYNAVTVQVVLAHYPVDSILDIKLSGFFSRGPWKAPLVTVDGLELSLNDIEHRILRPIWQRPEIHYAVNCASLGCPNLRAEAYEGSRIDAQLADAAAAFVNHPRGVRIENDDLIVSSIYDWFIEDFGDREAGVIAHLRQYAAPALARQLARFEGFDDDYDWSLNDATDMN